MATAEGGQLPPKLDGAPSRPKGAKAVKAGFPAGRHGAPPPLRPGMVPPGMPFYMPPGMFGFMNQGPFPGQLQKGKKEKKEKSEKKEKQKKGKRKERKVAKGEKKVSKRGDSSDSSKAASSSSGHSRKRKAKKTKAARKKRRSGKASSSGASSSSALSSHSGGDGEEERRRAAAAAAAAVSRLPAPVNGESLEQPQEPTEQTSEENPAATAEVALQGVPEDDGAARSASPSEQPPRPQPQPTDSTVASQPPERIDVVDLPRHLIGHIIGQGGATIKDIRERSGARIDAKDVSEDPVQVLVSGTRTAVETAKALLLGVAEVAAVSAGTDEQAASSTPVEPLVASSATASAKATSVPPKAATAKPGPLVQEHLELPANVTGRIIGLRGQKISEVRLTSGAQVDLDKSAASCRVRIVGTQEQVNKAKELIAEITDPKAEGTFMEIGRTAVGRLIGAGGARIQELQERSGAKIDIDRAAEPCLVWFAGQPENVAYAKSLVVEVLEGRDKATLGEAAVNIEIPPSCTGRLIGPGGRQINEIQESSGAKVDIDKSKDPCIVRMTGSTEAVARAEAMVRQVLSAIRSHRAGPLQSIIRPPGASLEEETINFEIPVGVAARLLDDGAWVRALERATGARAKARLLPNGCSQLELSGLPEQVVEAEQLAEEAVRSFGSLDTPAALEAGPAPPAVVPGARLLLRPPAPQTVPGLALPGPASQATTGSGSHAAGGSAAGAPVPKQPPVQQPAAEAISEISAQDTSKPTPKPERQMTEGPVAQQQPEPELKPAVQPQPQPQQAQLQQAEPQIKPQQATPQQPQQPQPEQPQPLPTQPQPQSQTPTDASGKEQPSQTEGASQTQQSQGKAQTEAKATAKTTAQLPQPPPPRTPPPPEQPWSEEHLQMLHAAVSRTLAAEAQAHAQAQAQAQAQGLLPPGLLYPPPPAFGIAGPGPVVVPLSLPMPVPLTLTPIATVPIPISQVMPTAPPGG